MSSVHITLGPSKDTSPTCTHAHTSICDSSFWTHDYVTGRHATTYKCTHFYDFLGLSPHCQHILLLNTQMLKGNVICLRWETISTRFTARERILTSQKLHGKSNHTTDNMFVLFQCHFLTDTSRRRVTERMKGWDERAESGQCVNLSFNHVRWRPRWKLLSLWEGRPTLGRVRVWKIANPAPQH